MGLFSRISKAIEGGKIEARQDRQARESQKANVAEQCHRFEEARERALDAAESAQKDCDVKGYDRYIKRAERNDQAIADAHRHSQSE